MIYINDKDKKIYLMKKIPKKIKLIKNKKENKKQIKRKLDKKKIFILVSLLVFFTSILVYGIRLIHFYKIEHPNNVETNILSTKIINDNEDNNNFKLKNSNYIFYGKSDNNYVSYSNQLWRIMKIEKDGSIILISDDIITSLVYGYETNKFSESYAYKWLNEKYYNLLNNPDNYLVENSYCISTKNNVCKKTEKAKIGLISYLDYKEAGANNSYLNIGKYFWTLTPSSDNKTWYVFDKGGINDNSYDRNNYHAYGIRPVIKLKSSLNYESGSGTKNDPYKIGENTLNAGAYIKYGNYTFKIYDKDETSYKLVLENNLTEKDDEIKRIFSNNSSNYKKGVYNSLYYYLNNRFYYNLDKSLIIDNDFYNGEYNDNYDYNNIYAKKVSAKVGLQNIADLFITDSYDNFTLTVYDEDSLYVVNDDGSTSVADVTSENSIRPAISITNNINIVSGSGTISDPYVVEGV